MEGSVEGLGYMLIGNNDTPSEGAKKPDWFNSVGEAVIKLNGTKMVAPPLSLSLPSFNAFRISTVLDYTSV